MKPSKSDKWMKGFDIPSKDLAEFKKNQDEIINYDRDVPYSFLWVVKWFIFGLDGPFGKVSGCDTESCIYKFVLDNLKCHNSSQAIFHTLKPHASSLIFQQYDYVNCSPSCVMFVYDMLITQTFQSWKQQ